MKTEFYRLNRDGMSKINDAAGKVWAVVVMSFFVGVALGYAWRMVQLGQ